VTPDVVLRGTVTELSHEPGRDEATIVVRGAFAADPLARIHQATVRLGLPAYHRALRAHRAGRAVEVRGSLELRRSGWLLHPDGLSVAEDEDEDDASSPVAERSDGSATAS
jgi:hypothetical protein